MGQKWGFQLLYDGLGKVFTKITYPVVTAKNVYQWIWNFVSLRVIGQFVKNKQTKKQMLRPLPESCWFSKHNSRASVAHGNRSSLIWLLEARRDLVQSRRGGKQTFGEGAMRSSSQRCLTSLPWCLDPWIWAAPSLAQSIHCILKDIMPPSPGSVSKLVPCFRLQGAIHSTMGYGSMVRPESPGGTSTWIASFSVHGFLIRSNVECG